LQQVAKQFQNITHQIVFLSAFQYPRTGDLTEKIKLSITVFLMEKENYDYWG